MQVAEMTKETLNRNVSSLQYDSLPRDRTKEAITGLNLISRSQRLKQKSALG